MKKFVVCRIIDTAPKPHADKDCPAYQALQRVPSPTLQTGKDPKKEVYDPLPAVGVVKSFIDRTYSISNRPCDNIGKKLNISV